MLGNRKLNIFEKLLLPVGIGLILIGLYLINLTSHIGTVEAWIRLCALFLWMILLFIVILSATSEDMKEELALLEKEHMLEIKLLRDISKQQLEEIKLLRLSSKKK